MECDFGKKANQFKEFFASESTPLSNGSTLPHSVSNIPTGELSSFQFNDQDILKMIRTLHVNKAYGCDDISIGMIKICDQSIVQPLSLIYRNCLNTGTFPDIWKTSNIVPVHKKGDKQIVNNYRPVSLLPVCRKILERLVFNSIFDFLDNNSLLSANQSGFRPSDSCESQLLSICHEIYASFDCYPTLEVRGVFLDISKAFDRVWHEGLIYKIKSIGISGPLLKLIESFLSNRYQRVLLNGQSSTWLPIIAGVPQGSILGPLFFLIYINDLSKNLSSITKLFADDPSIFSVVHDVDLSAKQLNDDLNKISEWAFQWKMAFNLDLSMQVQEIVFSRKTHKISNPKLNFHISPIVQDICQKHLGCCI